MPLQQDVFDLGSVGTGSQFLISEAIGQIQRGVVIGMIDMPTDQALESFLVGPIGAIDKMAARAFLGRVGGFHGVRCHPSLGGHPGQLLGNVF